MKLACLAVFLLGLASLEAAAQQGAPISKTRPSPGFGGANTQQLPPTKKSPDGLCHAPGTPNYAQIKDFFPFVTLEDCVKSGGRLPKR